MLGFFLGNESKKEMDRVANERYMNLKQSRTSSEPFRMINDLGGVVVYDANNGLVR